MTHMNKSSTWCLLQLMTLGQSLLPRRWFEYLMKKSFYGQFIPGSNHAEVVSLAKQLAIVGIRLLPAPSIEDELDETGKSINDRYQVVDCCQCTSPVRNQFC